MKHITTLALTLLFLSLKSNCQITQNNWLLSGNASFSSLKSSSAASVQFKQKNFQISPQVGYFLKDKFSIGLRPTVSFGSNNIANTSTIINIGPFVRYYFLHTENIFNLFTQGSYTYGSITGKGQGTGQKLNTFSFAAGPVLYFNSSVGLEFIIEYSTAKVVGFSGNNQEIKFGIGFQFHLEKE